MWNFAFVPPFFLFPAIFTATPMLIGLGLLADALGAADEILLAAMQESPPPGSQRRLQLIK